MASYSNNDVTHATGCYTQANLPNQNNEQPPNDNQITSLATTILNNQETNNLSTTHTPLPPVSLAGPPTEEERIRQEKKTFEKSLYDWLHDSSALGNKKEAAKRIRGAYNNKSTNLSLSNLGLTSIPDSIGNLTKLTTLTLSFNKLTSLPDSIGNLTALTSLDLSCNELTYLPASIGNLSALTWLDLSINRLTSIPDSIGSLSALTSLVLSFNKLTSIPGSIGNLSALTNLYLNSNQLTSIPVEIGNLLALKYLWIHYNPLLRELPLSLGNIPGITHIDNEETRISQEMIDSILALCSSHRDQEALHVLPARLEAWKQYAKGNESQNYDLNFIFQFDVSDKININEWLERLSKTRDFRFHQQELASLVCSILETLQENKPFREIFFPQIEGDFERCDDRTAQSLNETYTCWKLHTMDPKATLQEKLNLLAGLAKTGELRDTIKKTIETTNKKYVEQVEVVLYFENILKEKLGLVSAIKQTHYTPPKETLDWFNIEELEKTVNDHYKISMVRSSDFQNLALQDPSFVDQKKIIDEDFANTMTRLDEEQAINPDKEWRLSEKEYILKGKALIKNKLDALDTLSITWFDEQQAQKTTS